MRISGGEARGIRLKVPSGARPTSERVRQAVFSSLAAALPGARVLDLYCGSGAYGLEALSRGADAAVFVDRDPSAARVNAEAAGLSDWCTFHRGDADRFRPDGPYDLVFVDPPYARADPSGVLGRVTAVVPEGGRAVLEVRASRDDPPSVEGWSLAADRRYGDTRVLVYRRGGHP